MPAQSLPSALAILDDALLPVALTVAVGWLWRVSAPGGVDAGQARRVIGALTMNVFYPALVLAVIPHARLDLSLVAVPVLYALGVVAGAAVVWPLASLGPRLGLGPREVGALVLACAFGNIISIGIPLMRSVFGEAATRYAIYADLIGLSPLLWTLGVGVALRLGQSAGPGYAPTLGGTLVRLPPVWAFVGAIGLNVAGLRPAGSLQHTLEMVGNATMPAMLLTVGMALSARGLRRHARVAAAAGAVKLVLVPAVVWLLAAAWPGLGEAAPAVALLAACPTMMATLVLSDWFGLDSELLAAVLVTTTIAFFATLPAWLMVLL